MDQAFPLIVAFLMLAAVVAAVAYLATGASRGRKAQAAVFEAMARRLGGQVAAGRLFVRTPHGPAVIETVAVSIVEAMGSPYFSDGGTYTLVRAQHPRGTGMPLRAPVDHVLPGAIVVSGPAEAVVVLRGATAHEPPLAAALDVVTDVVARSVVAVS